MTAERDVEEALEIIVKKESRIDGFVANAGITKHQPALDFTREQVEELFKLNVNSRIIQLNLEEIAFTDQTRICRYLALSAAQQQRRESSWIWA